MVQRQVFYSRQCSHCLEVPQLQFIFVFLTMHSIETVHKTVEVPQLPPRGVSSSWTMSLTCSLLCCSSTRLSMSLLCRCLVTACATWSRSWRHATDHGNRECVSRCGADRGVLPQIMEIVEVYSVCDVEQIVASCHRSSNRGGDLRCSSCGCGRPCD